MKSLSMPGSKRKIIFFLTFAFLLVFAMGSIAFGGVIPNSDQGKSHGQAPANSPVIGDNWDLIRVDFIHFAKPENPGSSNKGPKSVDQCYKLMGVKWKATPVDYYVNPANPQGLTEPFISSTFSTSVETWDVWTTLNLFADTLFTDYTAQYGVQDFKNSIAFGLYGDSRAIAVTTVWYTLRGKQIVEFDQIYNTAFNWGDASINSALMDLENIAVHELGHAVGLDDIYSASCSNVTMYGYSTEGELSKRSLENPDIAGLQSIYGN